MEQGETMEDIVTDIIYKCRWVDGIKKDGALVSDRAIAKAIVEDWRVRPAVLVMPDVDEGSDWKSVAAMSAPLLVRDDRDSIFGGPIWPMAVRGGIKYERHAGVRVGFYGPEGAERCKFCKGHVVLEEGAWIHKWDRDPICIDVWSGTKLDTTATPAVDAEVEVDKSEP